MAEEGRKSGVTPEEDLLIGETPAFLSNKFYVTTNPYGTKITFAEGFMVDGAQQFRSRCAVYLVPSDVRDLYQLLEPIVQNMQSVRVGDIESTDDG